MAQADAQSAFASPVVRLLFGGDVMLGRGVGRRINAVGPGYPLGPVAGRMRQADLTLVNLECALKAGGPRWRGAPKAFYFGAPATAVETLSQAGVDLVSLANNHTLDFDQAGLRATLALLDQHGIGHAGAGLDLAAALQPALARRGGVCFGLAAFCDHQADFAAGRQRPGIAYLDLADEDAALARLRQALADLREAAVDWPILSLHWGPNLVLRPSEKFRRLAHGAVDMGWKILFGHSAHNFQGIELYRGCPVLYAAGDLVDDYRVDSPWQNDHQLLIEAELCAGAVRRLRLLPVLIAQGQARPAEGAAFDFIASRITALSAELGSTVWRDGARLWIDGGDPMPPRAGSGDAP